MHPHSRALDFHRSNSDSFLRETDPRVYWALRPLQPLVAQPESLAAVTKERHAELVQYARPRPPRPPRPARPPHPPPVGCKPSMEQENAKWKQVHHLWLIERLTDPRYNRAMLAKNTHVAAQRANKRPRSAHEDGDRELKSRRRCGKALLVLEMRNEEDRGYVAPT